MASANKAGKMAPAVSPERPTEMNAVICVFNIKKEGFNGVSSIETDIYYRLGWLWFAANSTDPGDSFMVFFLDLGLLN